MLFFSSSMLILAFAGPTAQPALLAAVPLNRVDHFNTALGNSGGKNGQAMLKKLKSRHKRAGG